jgi:hypothetical protein
MTFRVSGVHMKILLPILGLAWLAAFSASAQLSAEITMDQEQFLPNEKLPAAVHIINRSGRTLHFGADADWLTFNVESADGFVVIKNAEVPVTGEFDLDSSQEAIKRVDLQPYFNLTRAGRYQVTATVRVKDWSAQIASPAKKFDVISGVQLWSQDFGVPAAGVTNGAPEVRKYILQEANYLRSQLRLYVLVSDATESRVFKVAQIGNMVSFSQPETQLDSFSNLHILWQSGAATFVYVMVNPDGVILKQEIYDYVSTHPRLNVNTDGTVVVNGGALRVRPVAPDEMPVLKPAPTAKP